MVLLDPSFYHKTVIEGFDTALRSEKFPHALLISGPQGIGKKSLALSLAAALLCGRRSLEPCSCSICRKAGERTHPDLKWIPDEDGESLKVDQIREWIGWLRFQPFEKDKKVLVVEGAERLVDAALNAFLKMLEEPPESSHLILLTTAPTSLRSTLLSRCFHVALRPLVSSDLENALLKKGISKDEAHFLSLISQGIRQEAEKRLNQGEFAESEKRLQDLLSFHSYELAEKYLGRTVQKRSSEEKRRVAEDFLFAAQTFLRDVFLFKTESQAEDRLFFQHRRPWIEKKAAQESCGSLFEKLNEAEEIRKRLFHNANPRLALMGIAELMNPPILENEND